MDSKNGFAFGLMLTSTQLEFRANDMKRFLSHSLHGTVKRDEKTRYQQQGYVESHITVRFGGQIH